MFGIFVIMLYFCRANINYNMIKRMKKTVLLASLMMLGMTMWANTPVVTAEDQTTASEEVSDDYLDEEELEEVPKSPWSVFSSGFYFGFGGAKASGTMSLVSEVGVLNAVSVNYTFGNRNHLSLGIGYQYKSYSLKSKYAYGYDDGVVLIEPWPDGFSNRSSALRVHTWQLPLMYRKELGKKWEIFAAGTFNWNFYSSFNKSYKQDNTKYSATTNKLCQRKVSFDVLAGFRYSKIGVYCRVAPMSLFKNGCGPKIDNIVTGGLILGM